MTNRPTDQQSVCVRDISGYPDGFEREARPVGERPT